MRARFPLPLWGKVLLIAVLNAALLGAASVWFLRTLLAHDLGSILLGSARERIEGVASKLAADIARTESDDREALLARYSMQYGQTFYLFQNSAQQVAGQPIALPPEVRRRVLEGLRGPLGATGDFAGRGLRSSPPQVPPFLAIAAPGYWVGARLPIRFRGASFVELGVLLIPTKNLITDSFLFDTGPWLALLGAVLGITLLCWLPLVGGLTSAIHKTMLATAQIAAGKFGGKVHVRRTDELGQLGEAVNRMADQLEEHVHGQKRFLRDAAHELRSPLSRMQAALGILERQTGPESERLLGDLRDEIDVMSALTGDLLTFARSETAMTNARLTAVNVAAVTARAVMTENAGGAADIQVDVDPSLCVIAHEESLFRGVSNLVRNAIRYAGEAGPITVAGLTRDDFVILTIADQGPGIPADSMEKVFTPFYRVDSSRDRKTGGSGLGMSIAHACVETCQGTIQCRNGNPGLQVTIVLRLASAGDRTVSG